jgi:hypothetical protein
LLLQLQNGCIIVPEIAGSILTTRSKELIILLAMFRYLRGRGNHV